MPQSRAIAGHADRRSWMLPEAKREKLLYVSEEGGTREVYVFSYPQLKPVGELTGFSSPEGLCSDKIGDVFVTDVSANEITEFSHGGMSPIATLSDAGYEPFDCSVDPVTGNLAITNYRSSSNGPGNVAIYNDAKGNPTFYSDPNIYGYWGCGYDKTGNLFVDGYDGNSDFAELPKGAGTFIDLTLPFMTPGGIEWDGTYLSIGSAHGSSNGSVIYRVRRSGSTVRIVSSVPLNEPGGRRVSLRFFSINGKKVAATFNNHIGTWSYPSGGSPRVLPHYVSARGVTLSR